MTRKARQKSERYILVAIIGSARSRGPLDNLGDHGDSMAPVCGALMAQLCGHRQGPSETKSNAFGRGQHGNRSLRRTPRLDSESEVRLEPRAWSGSIATIGQSSKWGGRVGTSNLLLLLNLSACLPGDDSPAEWRCHGYERRISIKLLSPL